jgi:hypothetical protein
VREVDKKEGQRRTTRTTTTRRRRRKYTPYNSLSKMELWNGGMVE